MTDELFRQSECDSPTFRQLSICEGIYNTHNLVESIKYTKREDCVCELKSIEECVIFQDNSCDSPTFRQMSIQCDTGYEGDTGCDQGLKYEGYTGCDGCECQDQSTGCQGATGCQDQGTECQGITGYQECRGGHGNTMQYVPKLNDLPMNSEIKVDLARAMYTPKTEQKSCIIN
jgi:hypothetical protein